MSSSPLYAQFLYAIIESGGEKQQCLIEVYVVKDHSQHTIGVEFSSRTVKLGEKRIKLQVGSINLLPLDVSLI